MSVFRWHGWVLDVDTQATRAWYACAERWGCGCGHCRNFLAAADRLPRGMLDILGALDIPPEKTTDLCELFHEDGLLHYSASYRVAGRILSRPESGGAPEPWGGLWCSDDPKTFYPHGAPDFPQPCFDLGFCPTLPWVLDEPIDGTKPEP